MVINLQGHLVCEGVVTYDVGKPDVPVATSSQNLDQAELSAQQDARCEVGQFHARIIQSRRCSPAPATPGGATMNVDPSPSPGIIKPFDVRKPSCATARTSSRPRKLVPA